MPRSTCHLLLGTFLGCFVLWSGTTARAAEKETAVTPEAKKVVFKLKLAAGATQLSSRFMAADGQEIGGYYAYVKKL